MVREPGINSNQIPHDLPVDIKIPVDNPIACLGHPFPFYGGVLFSYRGGDIFRCLTDHFNRTSYGMRKIVVMDQIVRARPFAIRWRNTISFLMWMRRTLSDFNPDHILADEGFQERGYPFFREDVHLPAAEIF